MRIVVCVRGVPGDRTGLALGRGSATAVSLSLGLRASSHGSVTGLSVASDAEPLLRAVGALGGDAGVQVLTAPTTRLGIARAIASAAAETGVDVLVLGAGGSLAAMVAELLDLPLLDSAATLTVSGGEALAERRTHAAIELVAAPLPCVVSVADDAAPTRHPDLGGIVRSRSMPLQRLSPAQLGLPPEPEVVTTPSVAGQRAVEGAEPGAFALVDLLAREGVLR